MTSQLKVDKLQGRTTAGSITVTSEGTSVETNLQQGLCQHWINIDGTGTIATRDSFNNASITDVNTGTYKLTFSNNMANDDFCAASIGKMNRGTDNNGGANGVNTSDGEDAVNTTDFTVAYINVHRTSDVDVGYAGGHVRGDLA